MSSRFQPFIRFLGSMPVAISLLGAVAVASVIGTVLQQNQPYQDYIIKFGPFWHELFRKLGLYDVYSAAWFLLLLAFLVISTSICLIRNGPVFLRNAREFRENLGSGVLRHMPQYRDWQTPQAATGLADSAERVLSNHGYRMRRKDAEQRTLIAAKKGSANRLGYVFTHLAIVVICIGGLLDGNVPMKWRSMTGALEIETRDLPASQIPAISQLAENNPAFRANINIPEGAAANFAFIHMGAGYVLQKLPFQLQLKEFRIEHYSTGQPRSFESDVVLRDPETGEVREQTISVNQPLRYGNFSIYQASFQDGGSRLQMKLHPLTEPQADSVPLEAKVSDSLTVNTPMGDMRLELDDFRRHNILPVASEEIGRRFRDNGPSFIFRVRQPDGTAREYENFMLPIEMNDRPYFLSGVRSSQSEEFRYLYVPVDDNHSPQRFLRLVAWLHDEQRLQALLESSLGPRPVADGATGNDSDHMINQAALQLLRLFRDGGFPAIVERIDSNVPEDQRELASQAYIKLMYNGLKAVYLALLAEEGVRTSQGLSEAQEDFLDDAIQALAGLPNYGTPFFLELVDFEQRQASGLMITRSPGKPLVYPGFVLLLAGLFLLFYVAQRRIWVEFSDQDGHTRISIAGESNRLQEEFADEFEQIARALQSDARPGRIKP